MALVAVNKSASKKGDCETCERTGLTITLEHHNMWMCEFCVADEKIAITKIGEANAILKDAKKTDSAIEIKQDIFNATTVAATVIKGAIQHDENIADDMKHSAYAAATAERFTHFRALYNQKQAEMNEAYNVMLAWQIQSQEAAKFLKASEMEHYKQFDVNYKPAAPKKPAKPASNSGFKKQEMADAVKKFNQPEALIRMTMLTQNMNANDAARFLSETRSAAKQN
jgi:hypothetical protein